MKLLKITAFFIIIILSFASCKKDRNKIIINGSIYDPNTKVFVEGVKISLMANKLSNGTYNSGYTEIANATSDADGKFNIEITEDKVAGYRFYISRQNYFYFTKDYTADQIKGGNIYDLSFDIYAEGYVKLIIQNTVPFDTNDYISYNFSSGYLDCDQCCSNTVFHGAGFNFQNTLKCKTYGNQNVVVTWYVTKNNMTNMFNKTFFCNAFDTNTCIINY